jgi:hypothetical protein
VSDDSVTVHPFLAKHRFNRNVPGRTACSVPRFPNAKRYQARQKRKLCPASALPGGDAASNQVRRAQRLGNTAMDRKS